MAKALVDVAGGLGRAARQAQAPGEWIMASLRAAGARQPTIERMLRRASLLGEPLWRPPAPKGFSDEEAAWIDGLAQRLDIANTLRQPDRRSARSARRWSTRRSARWRRRRRGRRVARAESRPQAFALLLMSPEFQRR